MKVWLRKYDKTKIISKPISKEGEDEYTKYMNKIILENYKFKFEQEAENRDRSVWYQ